MKIIRNKDIILYSDLNLKELIKYYPSSNVNDILSTLYAVQILRKIEISKEDIILAKEISNNRCLPYGDVLQAILARNNHAIIITQDKHYQRLKDIAISKRPEEII